MGSVKRFEILGFSCVLWLLAANGCSPAAKPTGGVSCTPGAQPQCTCADGFTKAVQTCQANGTFGICSPCPGAAGTGGFGTAGLGAAGVGFQTAGIGAAGIGAAGIGAAGIGAAGVGAAGVAAPMGTCAAGETCQVAPIGGFKFCGPPGSQLPPTCTMANMPCGMNNEGMCFDAGAASSALAGMLYCLSMSCM